MYGKNNWLITLCPVKGRVWHPDCCSLLFCNVGTMVLPMETLASSRVTTGFLGVGERRKIPGIDQLCPSWLVLPEDLFGFLTVESSPKNECCWEEAESTWWSVARTTLPTSFLIYRGELKLTLLEDRHNILSRRTGGESVHGKAWLGSLSHSSGEIEVSRSPLEMLLHECMQYGKAGKEL